MSERLPDHLQQAAEQLPVSAIRLWNHLRDRRNVMLVMADRNARPLGRALEHLSVVSGHAIPTIDQAVHYRKLSARADQAALRRHVSGLLRSARDIELQEPTASLLVVDDYIDYGHTKLVFNELSRSAGVTMPIRWATLRGGSSDVRIRMEGCVEYPAWHDDPRIIGVDYTEALEPIDCTNETSELFYSEVKLATYGAVAALNGRLRD